ncbi:MAG: GNAT family N-acetyltransferase [Rhodobacteraceae bacterium]|nr:GNAT family N-acetyltransferase [Paracoccaceae bacterium]
MKARTSIHKAGTEDIDRLVPMIMAFHEEEGLDTDEAHIRRAITPLLAGSPHGEIFLAGPRMAPAGYALLCYGWSIEYGGLDAYLDEFYLRAAVRGRGMGGDVLQAVSEYLAKKGAKALALEVDFENEVAIRTYERSGFEKRARYGLMVRTLT